jgi:hypothetical protein
MKEVLEALDTYGLPRWTILLLAAAAIIAALIAALAALSVARFNARAALATARETAHREDRKSLVAPLLPYVRLCTAVAFEISDARPDSQDVGVQSRVWRQRLEAATPKMKIWIGDADLYAAVGYFGLVRQTLERALSNCEQSGSVSDFSAAQQAAVDLQRMSAIVETAAEGYVSQVSGISREAKRRLERLTRTRWVTWRGYRYIYWPPSAIRNLQWRKR